VRIIGGQFRGKPLSAPASQNTRPTTDRTREALFNILEHGYGIEFEALRVLDLFAGTGALGLEALSRGAQFCLFVEEAFEARGVIRSNIESLGLMGKTKIFRRDATKLGKASPMQPFDLVFMDPPYGKGLGELALKCLYSEGWLRQDCLIVFEDAKNSAYEVGAAFQLLDTRDYGDTSLHFIKQA
jgi:16S rRNA (guanine966-N2)-methyltransferase